jgi:hypothetical protein
VLTIRPFPYRVQENGLRQMASCLLSTWVRGDCIAYYIPERIASRRPLLEVEKSRAVGSSTGETVPHRRFACMCSGTVRKCECVVRHVNVDMNRADGTAQVGKRGRLHDRFGSFVLIRSNQIVGIKVRHLEAWTSAVASLGNIAARRMIKLARLTVPGIPWTLTERAETIKL